MAPDDLPVLPFASAAAWEAWLELEHVRARRRRGGEPRGVRAGRDAILYRVQDAKRPETRARRIERFVAMLARGETLH